MQKLDPRIASRIERYCRFYESDEPGLMVVMRPRWVGKKNLFDYDFTKNGHIEMAADMLVSARALLDEEIIPSDLIPWLTPDFGIAIHHTFLADAEVTFAEWTSWAPHPLAGDDGYSKLKDLHFSLDNRWVKATLETLSYWREHNDGTCLSAVLNFAPLDLANALRGNALFTDFYDYPDEVTELLRISTEAIIAFEKECRKITGEHIENIGMPFWGALAPKNSLYISEDTADMIGPVLTEEWALPWSRKIKDAFGSLAIHHHMLGAKCHNLLSSELRPGLMQLTTDPNCPPPMSCLDQWMEIHRQVPLMIDLSPQEIFDNIDKLRKLRAVIITNTNDRDEAKRIVELVRG